MAADRHNQERPLGFSGRHVRASLVEHAKEFPVEGRTIVVNLDATPAYLAEDPRAVIPAFSATTVVDSRLEQAGSVVLLRVDESTEIAGITREPGWAHFADVLAERAPAGAPPPSFPRATQLWRSPVDDGGVVVFDPAAMLGEGRGDRLRRFRVRVNLWFSPAGTDCGLHDRHDFIETHAQVAGFGRMQKFRREEHGSLYEDVLMSPGYATPVPFCAFGTDPVFRYPWHQYRADTDCVWLVAEYHLAD
ncbi:MULTISPECIES: hypothetical protein [unclassified Micromonospora]|uniref:hypothetical protein n=1 Tax=unclassified Micromonospora TaxID=2617518 RepID=UPI00363251D4